MMALVLGGASSLTLLNQFLHEEEGDRTHAYRDAGGVWTICKGLTHVDGNPVRKGMVLTPAQCDRLDREQEQKALALIDRIVNVPLTPPPEGGYCVILCVEYWTGKMRTQHLFAGTERRTPAGGLRANPSLDI